MKQVLYNTACVRQPALLIMRLISAFCVYFTHEVVYISFFNSAAKKKSTSFLILKLQTFSNFENYKLILGLVFNLGLKPFCSQGLLFEGRAQTYEMCYLP